MQGGERHAVAQKILYVITSFDRGKRLGRKFRGVDKLDYVLMMADEMREACEVRSNGKTRVDATTM